jgi:hypothetical protein
MNSQEEEWFKEQSWCLLANEVAVVNFYVGLCPLVLAVLAHIGHRVQLLVLTIHKNY